MKKALWGILFLELVLISPVPTRAEVNVGISVGIPLPPAIVFASPPQLIVLPETYVYVDPDVDADIFFYNGWWWRPWEGRWYRSRNYSSGWIYYSHVPSFYIGIPSGWRNDYRANSWGGHQWDYQRIPHQQVEQNWQSWEQNKHWEKQQNWGVQGLQPQQSRQLQQVQPRQSSHQQKGSHKKENKGKKGK